MSSQHIQDHNANVYLAITISPASPSYQNPEQLAVHPALTYIGPVGQLRDVQTFSVPREDWGRVQGDVLRQLSDLPGVQRVDVQEPPRQRAKRGLEDL